MTATTCLGAHGWYLYGITRRGPLPPLAADTRDPLQLFEFSELAAVVTRVRLDEFNVEALRPRLQNASELEAMVRSHNRVIEAIHSQQSILPAKFGLVHAHAEDVLSALRVAHDALFDQLQRLEGCDEWAVHLHADRALVRDRASRSDATIQRLRAQVTVARPGRAYFLEQQLREELDAATEQSLATLAHAAFDRLLPFAVCGHITPLAPREQDDRETEILRAAFLVAREQTDHFYTEVRTCADVSEGLRCVMSGPWPPYSFVAANEGEAR